MEVLDLDTENIPDQLDNISDEKLWDILDTFSNNKSEQKRNTKPEQVCYICKSANLIFTSGRGSYVCSDCGMENRELLDESPEWNNYEDGKVGNDRCGAPINAFFPKSSLGTTINAPGYSKVKMLRNWGQMPYKEHSLGKILNDIDNKCKKYKITKAVIDNAKILYKNIRETKHNSGINKGKNVIIRGFNRKQIIAACFYFGAILQKSPRSTKEVADIFNLELKQITKGCRKFLEIMKDNFIVFDIKPSHGSDFIERFGSKIKLSKNTIHTAKTIAKNATILDIASEHQATSIAAASILLAANILEENTTKRTISEVFDISDVTITKTYKKIYPYQQIVISDELTNRICHKINLKFLSDGLAKDDNGKDLVNNDIKPIETETDILIKKLNLQQTQYADEITTDTIEQNIELDESDIVKKDNAQSKNLKLLQLQREKEQRKLEKKKIKEEKEEQKRKEKEENKLRKIQLKQNRLSETDSMTSDTKKKRGRPKKNNTITVSNVLSV